ncbi:MAG: putative transposase [Planctomycetota bacterium]|jgi:putative transposase
MFLEEHWGQIPATDFFSVEVWTPIGLKTIFVLFVIDIKSRRVDLAGLTRIPNEAFMAQVARNLIDCMDGFLGGHRFLICDRDTKFTKQFKHALEAAGVEVLLTPVMVPNCNAYAERFVFSIKSECTNRVVFFGERHFREAVTSHLEHYHFERAHQGLGNLRIESGTSDGAGNVECVERLGGLLKCYRRAA